MTRRMVYPSCCTSAFCDALTCALDCPYLPRLKAFKAWVEKTGARVTDPTWSPTVYEAQQGIRTKEVPS